jgi:NAD+ diphosphatase
MTSQRFINVLAGVYIERAAHFRKDAAWLESALSSSDTLFIPVQGTRNAFMRVGDQLRARLFARGSDLLQSTMQSIEPPQTTFLGLLHGRACFAVKLDDNQLISDVGPTEFADLRTTVDLLDRNEAGLLAYARALITWQDRHRYCGCCGSATRLINGGHTAQCSDAACGNEQFPRIDPAIIVLVTDGDRALLGRQAVWPTGRYSTIAGFVEPGESLEDAVSREVLEETGVSIDDIKYHSSQPWPFPQSLMLGFIAQASNTAITLSDNELEDARWFSRADIAAGTVQFPPPISISGCLIEAWYNSQSQRPLREEAAAQTWSMKR